MVPDVFQLLVKEKGVFTNVISPTARGGGRGEWVYCERAHPDGTIPRPRSFLPLVLPPQTKAKLRLVFECAPIALLVENAGGHSSGDGKCMSALDVTVTGIDQRTQVCFGSKLEVARFEKYMFGAEAATRFADVMSQV